MEGTEGYTPSRAEAIKEITDTVLYLLRKKQLGTEDFEIGDLLDKNLEQNIIINFEGQISIPEYEKIIQRLCQIDTEELKKTGKSDLKVLVEKEISDLKVLVEKEMEKLILKMKMRTLTDINYRIFRTIRVPSEKGEFIKTVILVKYRELAQSMLQNVITDWMMKGINDDAKLMRAIKLERFELDPKEYNDILQTGKKLYFQKSKESGSSKNLVLPTPGQADSKTEQESKKDDTVKIKIAEDKMKKRQERFIDKFIKPLRFKLVENTEKEGQRYIGFRGVFLGKDIQINALMQDNRVQDMVISFSKPVRGQKKTYELNIIELKNIREGSGGGKAFTGKLNASLDIFDHTSLLEIIWFLIYGISEKNNIPTPLVRFLQQNILSHLQELDKALFNIFVQKAVTGK